MTTHEHVLVKVSVLAFLFRGDEILFQRRFSTGWEDGKYTVPSGRIDAGELPRAAMVRELREELGIEVKEEDLEMTYMDYVKDKNVNIFFKTEKWVGEPKIMEPNKCDEIKWIKLDEVPDNVVGRGKHILQDIQKGIRYAEYLDY